MSDALANELDDIERRIVRGRTVAYRQRGAGPVIVLIHGLAGTMGTWDPVIDDLSARFTVVALDLPGHGRSAPAADYSLGAFASCVRDLLDVLGHPSATVIGHSLGGGIAMQVAHQYPERCERLVLVSSGGLGRDVSVALRAASLPGTEHMVAVFAHQYVVAAARVVGRLAGAARLREDPELAESIRAYATLADKETRSSFFHTLRSVIDRRGQRVSAAEHLSSIDEIPSLLVWGAGDRVIPVSHARRAHRAMANSELRIFERSGHFPHVTNPTQFVRAVATFMDGTQPARWTRTTRRRGDGPLSARTGPTSSGPVADRHPTRALRAKATARSET